MIEIKNIVKNYVTGDTVVEALKNVSLNFRENEFVSILGQSGCGKTTLLNVLGGLDRYDSGEIIINGKSTKEFKDKDWDTYRNHYIGFIFQSYNLIPHLTVLENVEIALSIAGISKKEKKQKALKALERVGLSEQVNKKPNQLSGGQMQRVAIARAIVNNPKIILADEPTGALDSETSVQIMNLLKEIAGDHLIIMVTHNQELAKKYSSRIISLLDGKVTNDTNEYSITDAEREELKTKNNKNTENIQKTDKKTKKAKSAMGFFTAINLSLKNLLTKKGRTFLTSFAGSIGIIGIALVLAVSNGFTGYINNMQSNALGNYPITVASISMDMSKFATGPNNEKDTEEVEDDVLVPYNPMEQFVQYGHYNNLNSEFIQTVKDFEEQDKQNGNEKLNVVDYNYYVPVKMITKNSNNEYVFIQRTNATSVLSGSAESDIYPMIDNFDFVMNQYDLIYGSLPTKSANQDYTTEMLLVVGNGNKIASETLKSLGIATPTNQNGEYENISFEDICNQEYKLLFNNDYYTPNSTNLSDITEFDKVDTTSQVELETAFNSASVTCKISGIVKLKEDATADILANGIVYMKDLDDYYKQDCYNSIIGQKHILNKQSQDYTLYDPYVIDVAEIPVLPAFTSVNQINFFLNSQYGYSLSEEEAFDLAMQQIGISSVPIVIKFYPKNFEGKDAIVAMIKEYNKKQTNKNLEIVYSDTSAFLTSTLGEMVNIVSYVLIAFAGISLVVSSIMISIITYVSVIERTKEIGVLRSIGARKKDISRVFNAETLLIGFSSGLLGVLVSFLLTIPISAIIKAVAGGAITTNLAVLAPTSALILVAISVVLTLVAGFIPSKIAAKKDPVKALRSE